MNYYKLTIAYDGTDFHGWQVQPNHVTVASCMQDNFFRTFGKKVTLLGSSRTDKGVHALGQVARAVTEFDLDRTQLLEAWNNSLPKSILIRSLEKTSDAFHPLRNFEYKIYYYHLFYKQPLPFIARYGWLFPFMQFVDIDKFEKAMQLYVGEHDFRSFGKVEGEKLTVRTIYHISFEKFERFGAYRITIKGTGFLQYQIRRMIGAAIDVARNPELPVDYITSLLKNPNSEQQTLRADAYGLCLKKVVYGKQ